MHRGVHKKKAEPCTAIAVASNVNNTSSIVQSTDSDTTSPDASATVTLSPVRITNANMPQPQSMISRALASLTVPSHTNKHFESVGELEDKAAGNQEELKSPSTNSTIVTELNDENAYAGNILPSKRQSSRIQKVKRTYSTVSDNSPRRKKKKK
jgi:hypothetical protein